MQSKLIKLCKELIAIESVSNNEKKILIFIEKYLKRNKIKFRRILVSKDRWNVYAEKGTKGPGILFQAHCDTVPNKKFPKPRIRNGKLYGLGSTDMKAALGAMLYNFANINTDNLCGLLITVGEETALDGMAKAIKKNYLRKFKYSLTGEPSCMQIRTQQYGICDNYLRIKGKQRHTARLDEGKHPVHEMIFLLNRLITKFKKRKKQSIFATNILKGGFKMNVIPGEVEAHLDIRVSPKDSLKDINSFLKKNMPKNVEWKKGLWYGPVSTEKTTPLISFLKKALNEKRLYMFKGYTEMYFLQKIGIKPVCVGPGINDLAHVEGEYVRVRDVLKYQKLLEKVMKKEFK